MMMVPTMLVAVPSPPTVMVPVTAVMSIAMPVSMAMAAPDLDDGGIGGAERSRCRARHSRRRQVWSQCESAGGKPDQQEPFHFSVPSLKSLNRDREESFGNSSGSTGASLIDV